jgi:predicted RNA-binding protein associated with RNAse of E/G family
LTLQSQISVEHPKRVLGKIVADKGYLAIWFIFKGKWFDIGKFYDRSNNWLGYYCDIVKPVSSLLHGRKTSVITDLFLDLWISTDNECYVLDEEEFDKAVRTRLIPRRLAQKAESELLRLVKMVERDRFPPDSVKVIEPL